MKNIIKSGFLVLMAAFAFASCDPQDNDDHALGVAPREDQLSFTITPSDKANVYKLENTSSVSGVVVWDLGNGATIKEQKANAEYPFAGEYTVTMTLYTNGGSASINKAIKVESDNISLLGTDMYKKLTGGLDKDGGKTWVFDQFTEGHFGVFPDDNSWSWNAAPNAKGKTSLYKQEFTFVLKGGMKFVWTNGDYVYTNAAGKADLATKGHTDANQSEGDSDWNVGYTPDASYSFRMNELAKTITLGDGAFFGHYAGTSVYKITKLEDDVLEVTCASAVEAGNNWKYRFIPKDKFKVPMKAMKLKEDFEKPTDLSFSFASVNLGGKTGVSDNPAPNDAKNTSAKVYRYEKAKVTGEKAKAGFYASYTGSGFHFDLSEANKVTMKVYFPSNNDYSNNTLAKVVSVALQNSSWTIAEQQAGQAKKEVTISEMNKWVECTFDFSDVKTNKDFDRLVINMGGDAENASGIFYLDDFKFDK